MWQVVERQVKYSRVQRKLNWRGEWLYGSGLGTTVVVVVVVVVAVVVVVVVFVDVAVVCILRHISEL